MRSLIVVTLNSLTFLSMFAMLGARIWVAKTFWRSSTEKTSDFELILLRLVEKYEALSLSPEAIATITMVIEFACPIMIAVGLGARFAAAIMLLLFGIELSQQLNTGLYIWIAVLSLILTYGPNRISLDFVLAKTLLKPKSE